MAELTIKINVPDSKLFDRKTLQDQLVAFAKILVSYAPTKEEKTEDIHIFDCLSDDWGGNQDSHVISEELHNSRITRNVEAW